MGTMWSVWIAEDDDLTELAHVSEALVERNPGNPRLRRTRPDPRPLVISMTASCDVLLVGIDAVGGTHLLGLFEPVVQRVHDDDVAGAHAGKDHGEAEADAALAEDQDALLQWAAQLPAGIQHRARRLAHDPFVQSALIGEQGQPTRLRQDVLAQSSGAGIGNRDHPLPFLELVSLAFNYDAGEFMRSLARRHGVLGLIEHRAVGVTDIRATDADAFHLDQDLTVSGSGGVNIGELPPLWGYQLGCFHLEFAPLK